MDRCAPTWKGAGIKRFQCRNRTLFMSERTSNIRPLFSTDFPRIMVPSFGFVLPIAAECAGSREYEKPNKTKGFRGGRTRDRTLDLSRVKGVALQISRAPSTRILGYSLRYK